MESPPLSSSRSPRSRLVIGGRMDATTQPASQEEQAQKMVPPDNDRTVQELREIDCNLSALCDHIQMEGFNAGAFSDVVVIAMGSTYRLHRLVLSRSSYFRNMLHGPWKEVDAPTVTLQIDDANVNSEAISMSLAYLYGQHPKLNDSNAFRVLAAASFLDLQELCAFCTDFIISELWTTNFLVYQVFAESQDYGIHGERVRKACWGYLCQSATRELREVLPKLSAQTIHSLLTSDKLWVDNEEDRFSLALYILLTKSALRKEDHPEQATSSYQSGMGASDSHLPRGQHLIDGIDNKGHKTSQNSLVEFSDCSMRLPNNVSHLKPETVHDTISNQPIINACAKMGKTPSLNNPPSDSNDVQPSCSYTSVKDDAVTDRRVVNGSSIEGPSEESTCYNFNSNVWSSGSQSRQFSSICSSYSGMITSPSWGARTLGWRQCRNAEMISGLYGEEFDAFLNIFEGGSLLYCNMSFGALLYSRKQLEDIGFPCKAVNDGLWLQMLLSHRIQEIGADTCKNCCLISMSCACKQPYGYSQEGASVGYYRKEHDRNNASDNMGNVYVANGQGEGTGIYAPVRVHVRGPIDGLAGIGRGTTFVSDAAWPPTRFVFSRVPFGLGNRNEPEARIDLNGDISVDGLTTLVGSSQGSNVVPLHVEHTERAYGSGPANTATTDSIPLQMLETQEHAIGVGWDDSEISTLSLDMKTPLCHFPPFRFGVEFKDVHRLSDGQVKHSPEVFYAGSLWKITVQAFNDEDPQGRRTLGLFLHRRKAEPVESLKKVNMYVDSREKVTARYQLICPSKRELMVFGSLKQPGTLLPKAPKGWGWRTALLFDELADLLQSGSLRVAVLVQLICMYIYFHLIYIVSLNCRFPHRSFVT